jgi:hypothetical protein
MYKKGNNGQSGKFNSERTRGPFCYRYRIAASQNFSIPPNAANDTSVHPDTNLLFVSYRLKLPIRISFEGKKSCMFLLPPPPAP